MGSRPGGRAGSCRWEAGLLSFWKAHAPPKGSASTCAPAGCGRLPGPRELSLWGWGGQGLRCLQSLRGRWLPTSRAVAPARPLRGVSGSCFEGPSCRHRGPNAAGTPRQSEEQLLSCRGSRPPRATPARASHPSGPRPCSWGHGDSAKATSAQGCHCLSCHVLTLQQPRGKVQREAGSSLEEDPASPPSWPTGGSALGLGWRCPVPAGEGGSEGDGGPAGLGAGGLSNASVCLFIIFNKTAVSRADGSG